jgi:hypothetical protein
MSQKKAYTKMSPCLLYIFLIIAYTFKPSKCFEMKILFLCRRNEWPNPDADVKWAAKKDMPGGKSDIKKAVNKFYAC